jgi:hypothetical protein
MLKGLDWKYILMLVVTVALSSPWWITYITAGRDSLTVHVVSQASIQPLTGDLGNALVISVDGVPVKDPYISVLTITNQGDLRDRGARSCQGYSREYFFQDAC